MDDQITNESKPLILLYSTPLGFYFYDANRNEIVVINEQLYHYIDAVMKDDVKEMYLAGDEADKQYHELKECGYFSTHRVIEIKHPATDTLELLLERKIDSIILQVTQNCNLRCSYCVYSEKDFLSQRSHSDKMMSFETAKRAIDFFLMHSMDTQKPNIGFYGGEPFLNLELIKQAVTYAKKVFEGRTLTFSITTNATLLTDEIIDYLAENDINLTISLDGPKTIHDHNRVFAANQNGSYNTVIRNIRKLWERQPKYARLVSTNMVINPENSYEEINSLFNDKYISKMRSNHSIVERDNDESVFYSTEFRNAALYNQFLEILSMAKQFRVEDIGRITADEIEGMQRRMQEIRYGVLSDSAAPGGPCIPGKMRLFINYQGHFYPCERVSEMSSCMQLGSLDKGFDMSKVDALLNIGKLTEENCRDCWAFTQCMICSKKADDDGVLSSNKKSKFCKEAKETALLRIKNKVLLFELNRHLSRMTYIN